MENFERRKILSRQKKLSWQEKKCNFSPLNHLRTFYFAVFTLTWLSFSGCGETQRHAGATTLTEKKLFKLLAQREYFELRRALRDGQDSIGDNKKLFFKAFIENAFNQNIRSSEIVDQLLKDSTEELNDTLKAELLLLQRDNYIRVFN